MKLWPDQDHKIKLLDQAIKREAGMAMVRTEILFDETLAETKEERRFVKFIGSSEPYEHG